MSDGICSTTGCDEPVQVREWCKRHYQAWYRSQKFVNVRQFWSLVDKSAGNESCWLWLGASNDHGYGVYRGRGAHRVAYEIANNAELGRLHVDHVCHQTKCVNPIHLRPVTHKQNMENLAILLKQIQGGGPGGGMADSRGIGRPIVFKGEESKYAE